MKVEATHLGKVSKYPQHYEPNVLVRVERKLNREQYNIQENNLPFIGYDVWNAYEASFLTKKGLPVIGVLKIVYPCDRKYIVESKSLKLYLNSFNMSKYGNTREEGIKQVENIIIRDLSNLLETNVQVHWFKANRNAKRVYDRFISLEYKDILHDVDLEKIKFKKFNESPEVLKATKSKHLQVLYIKSNLLRSNCRVTHQPDWGTLFLHLKTYNHLDFRSLVEYIVSFRNENHFHEEVVEMIYKRLYDKLDPEDLMVGAVYTRRGGIDICPIRATNVDLLDMNLISPTSLCVKRFRQ